MFFIKTMIGIFLAVCIAKALIRSIDIAFIGIDNIFDKIERDIKN